MDHGRVEVETMDRLQLPLAQRPLGGKPYSSRAPAEPITTLWVRSLPEGVQDADLAEAFDLRPGACRHRP
eukprot:4619691-Amphidinium_carterae.1